MATSSAVADLGKKLLEASRKGNAEEVRQLMANGAPITTDWLGTSPLHLAAQYGHTVTAEVLLRAGVSRDGKTKVDKTPLHLSAQQGHFEISQMLVKCGAAINATDMTTVLAFLRNEKLIGSILFSLIMTPLHWAVEAKSEGICRLLMEHGARTDIKNKFGKTAVDLSKSKGYDAILKILISVAYVPRENSTKRLLKQDDSFILDSKKRARTRKFPMTAGSWTVGEMQMSEKEERLRPKEPRALIRNGDLSHEPTRQIKVISAEGSNLSSLVDAADIVRAKVKYPSNAPSSNELMHKVNSSSSSEPSVLDTLATLATASTQIATAGSDSSQQGQKVVSIPNPAAIVPPSYVTIPGIQGPVSIIQGNASQPALMQQGQIASALPPGMIQLASPLALNILPGGRIQIGQSVIPGHSLGVPIQMPVQQTAGIPAGHLLAVSSGQSIAVVGGVPPSHVIQRPVTVTDTTPSRQGAVMSPVSQGITSVLTPSTMSSTPQQLLTSSPSTTYQNEASKQQDSRGSSSVNLGIQPGLISQQQQQQPSISPIAASQLASAFQYTNLSPGITPIPLVPVAGIGGIQLVPQTMLHPHLMNAVRNGLPQSPGLGTVQPQVMAPGGAYTIPMSPLNLSSILPTALSLSQLPLSQQTINSLAHQSAVTALPAQSAVNVLAHQSSGAQHIISSQPQSIVLQSDPNTQNASQLQRRNSAQNCQATSSSHQSLSLSSGAQINLGAVTPQAQFSTVLSPQAFVNHQNITAAGLHHGIADPTTLQALVGQHAAGSQDRTQSMTIPVDQIARTSKGDIERGKEFTDSGKDNSLLANLTIASVESRSPSLIVNSSHSPRMPISPGNFVRNEDEMRGISPSQISPTKSRGSAQSIFSESKDSDDIIRSSNPFHDAASQQPIAKDGAHASLLPGDQVLPHLQQLIYKQLLQHQHAHQLQQQATHQDHNNPEAVQSTSCQESEAMKDDSSNQSPLPVASVHENAEAREFDDRSRGSPSDNFEDEERAQDPQNPQSEYFWRVMEQENSGLKQQLEADLEDDLYDDEFSKEDDKPDEPKSIAKNDDITDLLIKDENENGARSSPQNVNQRGNGGNDN